MIGTEGPNPIEGPKVPSNNTYLLLYTYLLIFYKFYHPSHININLQSFGSKDPQSFQIILILDIPSPSLIILLILTHPLRGFEESEYNEGTTSALLFGLRIDGNGWHFVLHIGLVQSRRRTVTHIWKPTMTDFLRKMGHYRIEKMVFFDRFVSNKEYFTSTMTHIWVEK